MIERRPIFKNKKESFDDILNSDRETDNSIADELDIYDSTKMKEYDEDDDSDIKILDELISGNYKKVRKERKKKEKKEKKRKKKDEQKQKKRQKKRENELLDLNDIYSLDEKKINRKKLSRDDEEFYESRFNGSLVILRELMKQVNQQVVTAEQLQEYFKNSKIRGSLTALANQGANISSLLSTKLNVIKEISNINKTISDLELKKAKEMKDAGKDDVSQNSEFVMNEIFKKIVNDDIDVTDIKDSGAVDSKKKKKKKNKKKNISADDMYNILDEEEELTLKESNIDDEDEDDDMDDYEDYDPDEDYDDTDLDSALEDRLNSLMGNGKIEFSDTELAYKYEDGVEIVVIKNPRTERWKFMALDKHGDEIYDYPLPLKNKRNTMTFDKENGYAKDKLNNVYRIMYYDEADPYDED